MSLQTIVDGQEITYLWEVKPASYKVDPNKSLGEQQLANYLNAELRADDKLYLNGGSTGYITNGEFSVTAPSGSRYQVHYVCMPNGLVLYWFESIDDDDDDDDPEEVSIPISVPVGEYSEIEVYSCSLV